MKSKGVDNPFNIFKIKFWTNLHIELARLRKYMRLFFKKQICKLIFNLGMVALTDMERAILRDLVCRVLQFLPQLTKAVNFAAELDWYAYICCTYSTY
jgi:hypothetical protein